MAIRAARVLAPRARLGARRAMATEKEIAIQIASTKNIMKITSSMKMVSAAKLKGDQNRLAAAKQFAAWTAVLDEPATPLEEIEGTHNLADHSVIVAISSDKGLCGGVHSYVARGLRTMSARLQDEGKTMSVISVGDKARSQLRRMIPEELKVAVTNIPPPYNFGYASTVAQMALDQEPEKTGCIGVIYNKFVSAIAYTTTLKTIKPFVLEGDDVTLTAYDADDEVLRGLREYYLATEIFYGMMEGATAEQSSRMQAMENATQNAGELIDSLTLIYNRARQARVTTELIEIISGAAALD